MIDPAQTSATPDLANPDSDPLAAIDSLLDKLEKFRGASESSAISGLLISFCEAVLRSEQVNEVLWASDPVEGIFHHGLTQRNKRFVRRVSDPTAFH